MATAYDAKTISFAAGQDLSNNQFMAVGMSSDGQIDPVENGTANNPGLLGILQNKPSAAGQEAEVAIGGVSKMVAGAQIDEGAWVTVVAGGRGSPVANGGTAYVVGVCVQAASGSGAIAGVLVMPQKIIGA